MLAASIQEIMKKPDDPGRLESVDMTGSVILARLPGHEHAEQSLSGESGNDANLACFAPEFPDLAVEFPAEAR